MSGTIRKTLIAGLLAAAAMSATAKAETVLRFSNWVPPQHPVSTDIINVYAERIAEATEGRVKVQVLSPGLGKPPAHLDLVKNGVADIAFAVHSYNADRFALPRVAELPFLAKDSTSASVAYWRMHEKYLAAANEHRGVKLLGLWVHGPAHIWTIKAPVNTLDDLGGQKIRVAGGITKDIANALGAVPFFAPAPKTYEALSKGVADGIFFPSESVPGFKLDKIIRHGLMVPGGLYRSSQYIVMNQAKWDALSDADKKAIDSVSGEALAKLAGEVWDRIDAKGIETMTASGIAMKTADGALLDSIRAKVAGFEGEWLATAKAKGVDGEAALAMLKAEIAGM